MATSFAPDPPATITPGPRPWVPGGSYWAFRRDPLAFFTQTARAYGDVAGFSFGPQKIYLLSHPDLVERVLLAPASQFGKGVALERAKRLLGNGLLTAAGAEHLKQRRTIQPLFHRQHVQGFAEAMVRHASRWNNSITPGARLDITAEMGALTLAIVGETLFSANVQGDADEVREALGDAVSSFAYAFVPFFDVLQKLPLPVFTRVRKARERLDRVIHRVIAARRAGIDKPEGLSPQLDLISMLLAARDPENPDAAGMSDQQIRDEAMTIFLAGHETTANAMAWTWHLLGSAPEVESLLHAEIDRVLGDDKPKGLSPREGVSPRVPTVEDVPKLEWTRAIVAESMRLFPPAWTMGRRVLETQNIGGHKIEKGALVILSQFVVHRDPRWWPAPESFQPSRWIPGSTSSARPKYAYFPFGGGSRICIGESCAWTEAILLLATIAQRWRFVPTSDPPPRPEPRITLRPHGLFMRSQARQ
jgi:cytochrome P450